MGGAGQRWVAQVKDGSCRLKMGRAGQRWVMQVKDGSKMGDGSGRLKIGCPEQLRASQSVLIMHSPPNKAWECQVILGNPQSQSDFPDVE